LLIRDGIFVVVKDQSNCQPKKIYISQPKIVALLKPCELGFFDSSFCNSAAAIKRHFDLLKEGEDRTVLILAFL